MTFTLLLWHLVGRKLLSLGLCAAFQSSSWRTLGRGSACRSWVALIFLPSSPLLGIGTTAVLETGMATSGCIFYKHLATLFLNLVKSCDCPLAFSRWRQMHLGCVFYLLFSPLKSLWPSSQRTSPGRDGLPCCWVPPGVCLKFACSTVFLKGAV